MFLYLGFPIGTIMFLSISLIMYFIKKRYNDIQNILFKYLLIFTYILLFLELFFVLTMNNLEQMSIVNMLACRLFLAGIILWSFTFFCYLLSIGFSNAQPEKKERFEQYIVYFLFFGSTLTSIADCFFEVNYITDVGLYAIVGPATYFVYGIIGVLILFLFIIIWKSRSQYSEVFKLPIFFSLFLVVGDIIHMFIFNINDLTLILALVVSSLYFTVESQDRMLLKEVGEARNQSEKINRAKTEFLANMSHEIRTPMNTILGFSNSLMMEKELTKEKVLEDAKSISKASTNLLDLINNILDISRIESGKEQINEKNYKISDVLLEINSLLISKSKENFNWYDLEYNKEMPSVYNGDYVKVVKIVSALVVNAIKYSDHGYINVSLKYELKDDKNYLVFTITNSKSTMSESFCNRDFSDFSKLDYGKANRMDSEFLGLVIAKRLVTMFEDSEIVFIRETEDTTKCVIKLCQKVIDRKAVGDSFIKIAPSEIIDCSNKKALIVDDNEINLKLAEKLLKEYNFDISLASSGNECINLVKVNDYDLILLDHMMPDLDGIRTMHILKSMNKKIPYIVAMTANSNTDSKDFYEKEGFDAFLGKPVNKKKLDVLISNLFGGNV